MENEFKVFDKENQLFNYLFEQIKLIIEANGKAKVRKLKILSCYFGVENSKKSEKIKSYILDKIRNKCKEYNISIELILSKGIYVKNSKYWKSSSYFQAFPNSRDNALFHGKAIAYIHGKDNAKMQLNGNKKIDVFPGDGFLLVTSANFSNAYFGNNFETGVLLKNPKTIKSYLLEFEKLKGDKNIKSFNAPYNSLFDVFSDGYILFQDDKKTLQGITSITFALNGTNQPNIFKLVGGEVTSENLTISLENRGYNIEEFEKKYPKPKNVFKKYFLKTPYGNWINKDLYDEIVNQYRDDFEAYKSEIKSVFTEKEIDEIAGSIEKDLLSRKKILDRLKDNSQIKIKESITKWKENFKIFLKNDDYLRILFNGYTEIELSIDPNQNESINNFIFFTRELNFEKNKWIESDLKMIQKKIKHRETAKSIKSIFRSYLLENNSNFEELKKGLKVFIKNIPLEKREMKLSSVKLMYHDVEIPDEVLGEDDTPSLHI